MAQNHHEFVVDMWSQLSRSEREVILPCPSPGEAQDSGEIISESATIEKYTIARWVMVMVIDARKRSGRVLYRFRQRQARYEIQV